jgi:hypothetical protein
MNYDDLHWFGWQKAWSRRGGERQARAWLAGAGPSLPTTESSAAAEYLRRQALPAMDPNDPRHS